MAKRYASILHQITTEQRHAAAREAADALVAAAIRDVIAAGLDITHEETILNFGTSAAAEHVCAGAPCGCVDDVIASAVFLVSELAIRMAAHQLRTDSNSYPSTPGGVA